MYRYILFLYLYIDPIISPADFLQHQLGDLMLHGLLQGHLSEEAFVIAKG